MVVLLVIEGHSLPLKRPPLFQLPAGWPLPKISREAFADALARNDSNENRARYARALAFYDELQGAFPFVAAGLGDDLQ
ncbi:MAG: hypothetical protein RL653_125 [Pseudomonadota bacterium]|jgi:hypothetical protein